MSDYAHGIDTCYNSGPGNWAVAKSRGVSFCYTRAGYTFVDGSLVVDTMAPIHLDGAKSQSILPGLYWFFRVAFDWTRQTKEFVRLLKLYYPGRWILRPALDVETGGATTSTAANRVKAACDYIFAELGVWPLIYTRQTIWDSTVANNLLWATLDLWAGRYNPYISGPWADGKYEFRDWQNWRIWQYSADGNGLGAHYGFGEPFKNTSGETKIPDHGIDLNWFNGSVNDLYTWAGLDIPIPPPTPPTENDWHLQMETHARSLGYTGVSWADCTKG